MSFAVQGAEIAQSPLIHFGNVRRIALQLIAIALAATLVAVEAPPAQAGASYNSQAGRVIRYAKSHIGAKFRPGDLIVWTKNGTVVHVGIAIDGSRAISALTSGVRTHRHHVSGVRFKAYLHVGLTN